METTRVLIVDDSIVFRRYLQEVLAQEPTFSVVATASDALDAAEKIISLKPDVITLDIEMPGMSGITFLRKLMQTNPMPVLMVSSYTEENSSSTIEALATGAVDFVLKPSSDGAQNKEGFEREIVQKLKTAAEGKISRLPVTTRGQREKSGTLLHSLYERPDQHLIAIGASTGGTRALYDVLKWLPLNTPGMVVVQHMPPNFTGPYAKRMDRLCLLSVKEAENMDDIRPGRVLIAPGGRHMKIEKTETGYRVCLVDRPPINFHRPSIDFLFQSVADTARNKAIGIILTGMGSDGAKGLLSMREQGAYTIAQNEETCVIFGMPRAAIKLGAVCEVVPIDDVSQTIIASLSGERPNGQGSHHR